MPPRTKAQTRRKPAATKAEPKAAANGRKYTTIRVEDLSDYNEYKNILVVGDTGVGKTVLVGGAPSAVFISTEKGTISAKRFGSKAKLIRVETWPQLEEALAYVEENAAKIGWVLLDSLPKMQRMLLRYLLDVNMEEGRKGADPDVPQIQDHQKWQNMFMRFVDRLNEMPVNVLYTSTPMRVETEDDEGDPMDIVLPAIQGKAKEGYAVAQYICAEMDSVWVMNMERRKGKRLRVLYTQKRPPYFAKCRYAALPGRVVLPDHDPTLMKRLLDRLDSGELAPPEPDDDPEGLEDIEEEPEDDDTEDDGEDSQEVHNRSVSKRRRKAAEAEEEPEDDEEEPEEEPAPPRKTSARKAASKRPTAREKARKKPEPEADDDINLDEDVEDDDDDYDNE